MINIENRDFGNINKNDAISKLKILDKYFDNKWLNGNSQHRFVNLIKRKDYYSTVELLNFAHALNLLNCDADFNTENWLKEQCKLIKGKDINNSNAAFFEILILGFLHSDHYIVKPTPMGHKGYDGIITFKNNDAINISIKNYKNTKYNDIFTNKCKNLDNRIYSLFFNKIKLSYDISIFIDEYPNDFENGCNEIINAITENASKFIGKANDILIIIEKVKCKVVLKLSNPEKLSKKISHRLFVACKHHKNEIKNLLDKIQDAVDNISKYSQSSNKLKNYVIIHTNDILKVSDVKSIIEKNVNLKDVHSIILLQPLITHEFNNQNIHMNYFYDEIAANKVNEKNILLI